MGAVYEAVHPALKKRFAIKTLLAERAQTPGARARFLREGEAASRINHPNVVDVVDVGVEDGTPYLVMELFEGETLGAYIARRGRVGMTDAVDILLPVISAVAAGHAQGVIHRDLKPSNVFLARMAWGDSIPKVLDFGVSKLTGDDDSIMRTDTTVVLGTLAYMSPEQARGSRRVDGQSDQYALGLILYEMLAGMRAHTGENLLEILHNIANNPAPPLGEVRRDLPPELAGLAMRMLAQAPGDRWPSLNVVGRALLPFASDKVRIAMSDRFRDTGPRPVLARVTGSAAAAAAAPGVDSDLAMASVVREAIVPPAKELAATLVLSRASPEPSTVVASIPRNGRPARIALAVAGAAAIAIVAAVALPRRTPPAAPPLAPVAAAAEVAPGAAAGAEALARQDLPRAEGRTTAPAENPPAAPEAEPPTAPPPVAAPGPAPVGRRMDARAIAARDRPATRRSKRHDGTAATREPPPPPRAAPPPTASETTPPALTTAPVKSGERSGTAVDAPSPRRGTNDALIIK